jgi:hypothetical protein
VQAKRKPKPVRLGNGMGLQVHPLLAQVFNGALGYTDARIKIEYTADTGSFHCLQVKGYAFFANMPVHPKPKRLRIVTNLRIAE